MAFLKNGIDRDHRDYRVIVSPPAGNWRVLVVDGTTILVYDDGRIWNIKMGRWYKTYTDTDGYKISGFGKVHRVVLYAFVGPPPLRRKSEARHLDGVLSNNRLQNLCWGSYEDNWLDRKRHYGPSGGNVSQKGIPRARRNIEKGART